MTRDAIHAKFVAARSAMCSAPIERDEEVDVVLTALLAHEHLLLLGPPDCGKSLMLDLLLSCTGGQKFSILFTKFTVPEEVAGPVSSDRDPSTDRRVIRTSGYELNERTGEINVQVAEGLAAGGWVGIRANKLLLALKGRDW